MTKKTRFDLVFQDFCQCDAFLLFLGYSANFSTPEYEQGHFDTFFHIVFAWFKSTVPKVFLQGYWNLFANGRKSLIRDKMEIGFEGRVLIVKVKCCKKFFAWCKSRKIRVICFKRKRFISERAIIKDKVKQKVFQILCPTICYHIWSCIQVKKMIVWRSVEDQSKISWRSVKDQSKISRRSVEDQLKISW